MSRHRNPAAPASPTPSPSAPRRSAGTFVKGVGSLLLVLLFVAGVPWLLLRIGAFPTSAPDPGALWRSMTGPDLSGRAVFTVLAALVWLGWAWFTLSVLKETTAAISSSGRQTPPVLATDVSPSFLEHAARRRVGRCHRRHVRRHTPAGRGCSTSRGRRPPRYRQQPARHRRHRRTQPLPRHVWQQLGDPGARHAQRTSDRCGQPNRAHHGERLEKHQEHQKHRGHHDVHGAPLRHPVVDRAAPVGRSHPLPRDRHPEPAPETGHHHSHRRRPHPSPTQQPGRQTSTPTPRTDRLRQSCIRTHLPHLPLPPTSPSSWATPCPRSQPNTAFATGTPSGMRTRARPNPAANTSPTPTTSRSAGTSPSPPQRPRQHPTATPAPAAPAAPAAPTAPGAGTSSADAPDAQGSTTPPAGTVASAPAGADHRRGPAGENREQDPASPVDAGQVPVAPSTVPLSAQAQASTPAGQPGQASPVVSGQETQEPDLATVAGYVAGGTVLAAGILGALVLVRRQQFRDRRPGRTIASTPEPLIPLERAIVSAGAPSADEMARVDQVLRRIAATDVPVLHVAAVQLHAGEITVHLSEPALLPAPWRPATDEDAGADTIGGSSDAAGEAVVEGVVWTFPAGLDAEEAGADPSIVEAIAPFPTLVHIGSDATSAWLLNLEQTGTLVLTGDGDRCLSLARVMSAQLGVNAWADIVAVTMLGFGQELIETAPSRLRYAPADAAGQVLAAATGSANQTADFAGGLGLAVVEARRWAAGDEAWPVHVLLATTAAADDRTRAGRRRARAGRRCCRCRCNVPARRAARGGAPAVRSHRRRRGGRGRAAARRQPRRLHRRHAWRTWTPPAP